MPIKAPLIQGSTLRLPDTENGPSGPESIRDQGPLYADGRNENHYHTLESSLKTADTITKTDGHRSPDGEFLP